VFKIESISVNDSDMTRVAISRLTDALDRISKSRVEHARYFTPEGSVVDVGKETFINNCNVSAVDGERV
jgi:hypothetical protein